MKPKLSELWSLPLINCTEGFFCGLAYRDEKQVIRCAGVRSLCTKTRANTSTKRKPTGKARKRLAVRRERPLWLVCHTGVYVGEKVNY